MTRIIGGLVGSRKLASPAKSTRPTSDRIRESIFNSLESKNVLEKARVLDLYAGTGALGLEALSRGSKLAVLVENNKQAAAVCIKNSRLIQDALAEEDHEVVAKVQIQPVKKYLETVNEVFDLVFIDPPYEISNTEVEHNLESLKPLLADKALVVVERSARAEPIATAGYDLIETKNFGDTAVYWLTPS
jgi:16S rRNA (guanine966-N2)-methyltransferase